MPRSVAKSWHVSHASDFCLLLSWLIILAYVILKDTTQENARCLLFFCLRLNDWHLKFRLRVSVGTCSSAGLCLWPLAWEQRRIRGSQRAQEKGFFFFRIRVIVFHIFSIFVSSLWVGLWFLFFFVICFFDFLKEWDQITTIMEKKTLIWSLRIFSLTFIVDEKIRQIITCCSQ